MATYFKAVRECLLAVNSQLTIYAKLLLPINFFICVSAFLFACFSLSIPKILKCSIQVIFEFFIQVAHRYFLRVMIFHHKLPLVLSKQYVIQNSLPYLLQLSSKQGYDRVQLKINQPNIVLYSSCIILLSLDFTPIAQT